jgi:hypothetical protein
VVAFLAAGFAAAFFTGVVAFFAAGFAAVLFTGVAAFFAAGFAAVLFTGVAALFAAGVAVDFVAGAFGAAFCGAEVSTASAGGCAPCARGFGTVTGWVSRARVGSSGRGGGFLGLPITSSQRVWSPPWR